MRLVEDRRDLDSPLVPWGGKTYTIRLEGHFNGMMVLGRVKFLTRMPGNLCGCVWKINKMGRGW